VEKATGTSLPSYADQVLFGPLGIRERAWEELDGGYVNGSSGLDLRARDLARFGQLVLQRGWSGNRSIVSRPFVEAATTRRYATLGRVGPISDLSYGYLWWTDDARRAFLAWGFAGQFVYVAPELDLVVVATTEWRGVQGDIGNVRLQDEVIGVIVDRVLAAVR
jgi:CubicO group peptidase (beta-lactamase class C family)